MSFVAKGPNGQPMLALSTSGSAAQARSDATMRALQHTFANRNAAWRDKIKSGEIDVTDVPLDRGPRGPVKATTGWAIPRQIPEGPHAGKWYVPVPAADELRFQFDKNGDVTDRPHPAWAGADIVESEGGWFPSEEP